MAVIFPCSKKGFKRSESKHCCSIFLFSFHRKKNTSSLKSHVQVVPRESAHMSWSNMSLCYREARVPKNKYPSQSSTSFLYVCLSASASSSTCWSLFFNCSISCECCLPSSMYLSISLTATRSHSFATLSCLSASPSYCSTSPAHFSASIALCCAISSSFLGWSTPP